MGMRWGSFQEGRGPKIGIPAGKKYAIRVMGTGLLLDMKKAMTENANYCCGVRELERV